MQHDALAPTAELNGMHETLPDVGFGHLTVSVHRCRSGQGKSRLSMSGHMLKPRARCPTCRALTQQHQSMAL